MTACTVCMVAAFTIASVVAQANQCSGGGECPSDDMPKGVVSLLQRSGNLDVSPSFTSFIQQYGRAYSAHPKEYKLRQNLFAKRLKEVHQQNSQPDRLWDAAVNHLTDRTEGELSQLRGLRPMQSSTKAPGVVGPHGQFLSQVRSASIPEEKSWANLTAVQQEVDQGGCGSCWAFAAVGMLQANAEIHGLNRTFSPQELVDCVPNTHSCGGAGGCQGATVELAMNWVIAQGLETESSTPYQGFDRSCKKTSLLHTGAHDKQTLKDMIAEGFHSASEQAGPNPIAGLQGWTRLPENKYHPTLAAVATMGPVAVSVAANEWSWYSTGVFNGCVSDVTINHAVLLIGYGNVQHETKGKIGYWLVKNSWGKGWGEAGSIKLLREEGVNGDNARCGTDKMPKDGTGCDDAPSTVHVCGTCGILYDNVVAHFEQTQP